MLFIQCVIGKPGFANMRRCWCAKLYNVRRLVDAYHYCLSVFMYGAGAARLSGSDHLQRGDQSWHVSGAFATARAGAGGRGICCCYQAGRVGVDGVRPEPAGDGAALEVIWR